MEAIYKQKLLNKLCDACGHCANEENAMRSTHPLYNAAKCSVYKLISDVPSIDEDDTCGEWVDIKLEFGIRSYKCSICNHICQAHSLRTFDPPPYCMYCGSRMINGRDSDGEIR